MSFLGIDKWARLYRIIRQSGGIFKAAYKLWRFDTLKEGKYVGCDALGNKYYTNCNYMIGRSRWVEYNPNVRWEYDASQVTSEWFGWLHYKTDKLPCEDCAKYTLNCCCWAHCWLQPYVENMTGTEEAYYPYSTTKSHIHVWDDHYNSQNKIVNSYVNTYKFLLRKILINKRQIRNEPEITFLTFDDIFKSCALCSRSKD